MDVSRSAAAVASAWKENRPAFSQFSNCISSKGWQIIPALPWLDINESQLIPPFIVAEVEKPASLVRDVDLAIYWAADIVENGAPLSYSAAVASIVELNNRHHGGRSDWRLPTEKELRAIGHTMKRNQAAGNDVRNHRLPAVLQQPVPFWTASHEMQGTSVALRIADGKTFSLPDEGPYAAHLLPVAGVGWGQISRIAANKHSDM